MRLRFVTTSEPALTPLQASLSLLTRNAIKSSRVWPGVIVSPNRWPPPGGFGEFWRMHSTA